MCRPLKWFQYKFIDKMELIFSNFKHISIFDIGRKHLTATNRKKVKLLIFLLQLN
jgi:hypothetical protein